MNRFRASLIRVICFTSLAVLSLLTASMPALARGGKPACFNGFTDPTIAIFLQPNTVCHRSVDGTCRIETLDLHETQATIEQIHEKIADAYRKYGIDPRLIYYRLLGEAQGDPFAVAANGDGGYGIFQMTGGLRSTGPHRQNLEALQRKFPATSPRLLQLTYYVDAYVDQMAQFARYGGKKGFSFEDYSQLEKLTYLGFGRCNERAYANESRIFRTNRSYLAGASAVLSSLIDFSEEGWAPRHPLPLCENY